MTISIRQATRDDLSTAKILLSDAGLPVDDLSATHLAFVGIAEDDVVGVIGFENHGRVGLLRSLVVAEDARASGLGRELVAALEASAREQGIDEIWLLTIDADPFFAQLGYQIRGRSSAPPEIAGTAEFTALCPGDAFLMCKAL